MMREAKRVELAYLGSVTTAGARDRLQIFIESKAGEEPFRE